LPALASNEERGIVAGSSSFFLGAAAGNSKPAKAPIGSDPKPAKAPLGSETLSAPLDPVQASVETAESGGISAGSISLEKESGRSACEPYRQVILEKLDQGLSAQRIYQDLVGDGFDREYHSVRRFVAKLQKTSPLPFRRMESASGEEAQIDFGTGAWIELPDGKRRRTHVFRIVLSYSRKGYCEAVYRHPRPVPAPCRDRHDHRPQLPPTQSGRSSGIALRQRPDIQGGEAHETGIVRGFREGVDWKGPITPMRGNQQQIGWF
jgi:hypothetical protein